MRKFLLLLSFLTIVCGLKAQDPAYTLTCNTSTDNAFTTVDGSGSSGYTTDAKLTDKVSGKAWNTTAFNYNSGNGGWADFICCGRKNNASTATISTDFAAIEKINKVTVDVVRRTAVSSGKNVITTLKLYISENADFSNATSVDIDVSGLGTTKNSVATFTADINSPAANCYYKIEFDMPAGSANGYIGVKNVKYYGEIEAGSLEAPIITMGENNMVSISQVDGANIYYTTDETNPTTASTLYSNPFAITGITTVKAIASKDGKLSAVTTKLLYPNTVNSIAEFLELKSTDAVKIDAPLTAIYQCGRNLYLTDGTDFILVYNESNLESVSGLACVNGDQLSFITGKYKSQNGLPELIPTAVGEKSAGTAVEPEEIDIESIATDYLNKFVVIYDVNIVEATKANNYTATDPTGEITVYNTFNNATYYPNAILQPDGTYSNTIPTGDGFTMTGFVSCYSTTMQITPIAFEGGTVMEKVETPVFMPANGSELNIGDEIVIESATEGATIYLDFDGNTPTTDSQIYEGPLTFSEACTIKAIAVKDGMINSDVATATYTVKIAGLEKATFNFTDEEALKAQAVDKSYVTGAPEAGNGLNLPDQTFTEGPVALSFGDGGNKSNKPVWWNATGTYAGIEGRFYKDNEMSISLTEDGYKITKVTFTQRTGSTNWAGVNVSTNLGEVSSSNPDAGTYTASSKTYEAPENGMVNFVNFAATGTNRFATIVVEYMEDPEGVMGIEDIVADDENAPAEYYNLQGVRVNSSNLAPGIYIVRQGSKAYKMLVK